MFDDIGSTGDDSLIADILEPPSSDQVEKPPDIPKKVSLILSEYLEYSGT